MAQSSPTSLGRRTFVCATSLVSALVVLGALAIAVHFPQRDSATSPIALDLPPRQATIKRVLLVLVDGLRHDTAFDPQAMPYLNRLKARGAWGIAQNPNLTLTNLAVINIGTGAPPKITKVLQNFKNSPVQKHSLFTVLRARHHRIGFIGHTVWKELFGHDADFAVGSKDRGIEDIYDSDDRALRIALPRVRNRAFDFLVVHVHGVDHAGHKYTPRHPMYRRLARRIDGFIHQLHDADPEATLLVMADHGMTMKGTHGGGEPDCARVPFVLFGPGIRRASGLRASLSDFAPTLLSLFGVPDLGSAQGRILTEAMTVTAREGFALWRRYLAARLRFLRAVALARGVEPPPLDALSKARSAYARGDLPAALRGAERQARDFVRYTRDTLESRTTLGWLEYALILLLAASGLLWVRRFDDRALELPRIASVIAVLALAAAVIAILFQASAIAAAISYAQLLALAALLVRRRDTSRNDALLERRPAASGNVALPLHADADRASNGSAQRARTQWALVGSAIGLAVGLAIVLYGATALYRYYLVEHGITGWTVFLPALDRWYMPRLQAIFGGVALLALLLATARRTLARALPDPSIIGGGLLLALAVILSVFYWEGNNMARLAAIIALYATVAYVRAGLTRKRWFSPGIWFLALCGLALWQIGYRAGRLSIDFHATHLGWHLTSLALLVGYGGWLGARSRGYFRLAAEGSEHGPAGGEVSNRETSAPPATRAESTAVSARGTLVSFGLAFAALLSAHLYRYTQTQSLVFITLALAACAVITLPLAVPRALRALVLPLALLAVYRMLCHDVQMVVIVLAAASATTWMELSERGDLPRSALMTAIVLVSWNLLVFFASGYFWNFSSVEVVLAFVGRPDEIHLAWAIGLIMLKYGIPWMLLVGAFFGARARRRFRTPSRAGETAAREDAASSAETLGRPPWSALVAVVFCYICMIAGLLLTFETLKTHIEFGSKALPTAVFSYVHSGLFAVAITLLAAVFLPRDRFASTSGVL